MKRPTRKKSSGRDQRGFSLIELMVSITLSLAIMLALSTVYVASKQSFRYQETTGRLQEDAGFALDLIAKDLRVAGFGGCMGVTTVTSGSPAVTTYYPTSGLSSANPDGINGSNPLATLEPTNLGVTAQPLMPGSVVRGFDTLPTAMYSGTVSVSGNSGSLFFYSGGTSAVAVNAAMAASTDPLMVASDPYKWRNETNASGVFDFVVSSCTASSLFKGKVAVSGSAYQISHDSALGNAAAALSSGSTYGTDAMVFPVEWKLYFIGTRAGASAPSLYVISYNGNQRSAAQEMVPNVESMRLNYGENTSNLTDPVTAVVTPTLVTDVWRATAADVTDWSRVTAVRIGLMMVTSDDNANSGVTLVTPKLLGLTYTPPTGASLKRARKAFSTTVVLRNQVAARE
jgi:type IV pilus assembly protein PilW